MNPDRWAHVQALFEATLEQAPTDRAAYLRTACEGDAALFDEVASLLDADDDSLPLLEGHALEHVDELVSDDLVSEEGLVPDDFEGMQVGAYRLQRLLGEGGMGRVYLAERADGLYEQQVALKLIKRGMDTAQIVRRFEVERQILARLQHAHIARLVDGGVTDDGRPYFVMEYVDGLPIDTYCDTHRLTVDERLDLFVTVCKAVLFAHANLVVHRDLKPENILVTPDGTVKLLDFGIAKVLQDDEEATRLTQVGARVLTPGYASPEQMQGEPIGTASDIYSLGVVLYELLAGQRPPAATGEVYSQALATTEPERPSTAVSRSSGEQATTVSEARRTQPDKLRQRLAGDLDVICLKALRSEPERRYGSVEAFAEDVRRHRVGLPVLARPDTVGYRVRKFVQRNRAGVALATTALLVIVSLVGFYTARLAQERDRARLEAAKATEVTAFLTDIFDQSDPVVTLGEALTVRAVLDSGAVRVPRDLAGQPELQASLLHTLGDIYDNLGEHEQAEGLLREAVALRRAEDDPAALADALSAYGEVLLTLDRTDEALPVMEDALRLHAQVHGPSHAAVGATLSELGTLKRRTGAYDEAETHLRDAIAIQRALGDEATLELARTLGRLGLLFESVGRLDDAVPLLSEALALERQAHGDAHPSVAAALQNLGIVQRERGDDAAAEQAYRDALAINERVYGSEHPETATAMRNLASVLRDQEAYDEAEALYLRALTIRSAKLGEGHPSIANVLNSLATLYVRRGDLDQAAVTYERALALYRASPSSEPSRLAPPLHNLARVHEDRGAITEAEAYYREALALQRAHLPPRSTNLAFPLGGLGTLLTRAGRTDEAVALLTEAVEIRRAGLPPDHRYTARAELWLSDALEAAGEAAAAETVLRESVARMRTANADSALVAQAEARLTSFEP